MQLSLWGGNQALQWQLTSLPHPFQSYYYISVGITTTPFTNGATSINPNTIVDSKQAVGSSDLFTPRYTKQASAGSYKLYGFYQLRSDNKYYISTNVATANVFYEQTYSVTLSCGTGVASFDTTLPGNNAKNVTSNVTISGVSQNTSYTVLNVVPQDGFTTPYIMYYNIASEPGNQYAGSKEFNSTDTFSVSNYNRLIQIAATPDIHYYYKCIMYLDDVEWYESNTVRTEDDIVYIDDIIESFSGGYNVDRITGNGYTITGTYCYITSSKNDPSRPVVFRLYCNRGLVTPDIEYVSATATTITVSWNKNGGTVGSWYILYDTVGTDWNTSTKIRVTTPGNYTITNLDYKKGYFISCVNSSGLAYKQSEDIYVGRGGGGGGGGGRTIQPFAWTANDDQYIRAGQPITNLKASAWNSLLDKMAEVCNVNGQIITDINGQWTGRLRVSSGETIGKIKFNVLVSDLAQMYGTGNVVDPVGDGYQVIKATYFANDLKYFEDIKSAINRAINAINT